MSTVFRRREGGVLVAVYLDHAATSPLRPEVLAAYVDALQRRRQSVVDPLERAGRP